jgi:hypothetical protein
MNTSPNDAQRIAENNSLIGNLAALRQEMLSVKNLWEADKQRVKEEERKSGDAARRLAETQRKGSEDARRLEEDLNAALARFLSSPSPPLFPPYFNSWFRCF